MGKAARRKRHQQENKRAYQEALKAARTQWLGKRVAFDADRGDGVQQGTVTEISEEGLVSVECLPEFRGRVVGLMFTLNFLDRLKLV